MVNNARPDIKYRRGGVTLRSRNARRRFHFGFDIRLVVI